MLATDFQFAKQNKFALIGKIHRKDCLDFNAAASACRVLSLQEALSALMPSQARHLPSKAVVSTEQISSLGPRLGGLVPCTLEEGAWRWTDRGLSHPTVTLLLGAAV